MKKFLTIILIVCCAFAVFAADSTSNESNIQDVINGFSYYLGAQSFLDNYQYYKSVEPNYFAQGVVDYANGEFRLTNDQINYYIQAFGEYYNAIQQELANMAAANLKDAETFLAANKSKKGVTTTSSGLQYKVNKKGSGKTAKSSNSVTVYYTLTLMDGTVVDQCVSPSDPITFSLNGVIPGFAEACTVAPAGSKITAWVHPDIGYGESGSGSIEPNTLLIFDIEIVSVQ